MNWKLTLLIFILQEAKQCPYILDCTWNECSITCQKNFIQHAFFSISYGFQIGIGSSGIWMLYLKSEISVLCSPWSLANLIFVTIFAWELSLEFNKYVCIYSFRITLLVSCAGIKSFNVVTTSRLSDLQHGWYGMYMTSKLV